MEPKRRRTSSPLTAGRDAGSCKKTGDSPQEQEEELNEGKRHVMFRLKRSQERRLRQRTRPVVDQGFTDITRENLKKHVIGFPTQSEQMTADEKFSEEAVLEKMPSTSVSSFINYSHLAPLFAQGPSFFDARPIPYQKPIISAQSVRDNISSKTKGETGEKTDQVQDLRPEKKKKEEIFPQKQAQPEPLSDTASFSATHNMKVRHQCKSLHEMSDEPRLFSGLGQRRGIQRGSLFNSSNSSHPWLTWQHSSSSEKSPVVVQGFAHITGKSLKKHAGGFPVQLQEPGGDHSTKEATGPPFSIKYSLPEYFNACAADPITMSGMIRSQYSAADVSPGVSQDNIREMEPPATAGPSTLQLSTNDESDVGECYESYEDLDETFQYPASRFVFTRSQESDQILNTSDREDIHDGVSSFDTVIIPNLSQSKAPSLPAPPPAQSWPVVLQESTVFAEGSRTQDGFDLLSLQSESESGGDSDVLGEMEAPVQAVNYSTTNTLPTHCQLQTSSSDPGWTERGSRCLTRSHSFPSLSQKTSAKTDTFRRSHSLPDMKLKTSVEEFTPDITADEDDETFSFQCSCPGLYQCSVTGLVFHMEGGGDVVYRIVPWNRRLLAQHHKQPAGPLFDIKCLQQSVCRLHLPHCEIRSTGEFLSVAHMNDESIEFIRPHEVTETHVIINITGFSAFGNVKDEDSPPDPVQALVLLFYRPPADPDPESLLNVLLLPRNVVLLDVLRCRKKFIGDERYTETSPHCKLHPKQEYTLSTCPEDSVLVQPQEAEFDGTSYDNYFPSFQVDLETVMKHIKLFLRDKSSHSVWERRVCLSSTRVKRSCGPSALNLPPDEKLLDIRSSFIDGISGPVLKSLLDKLFEKKVMTDSERESANDIQNKRDKARFVIDTVRKKGEAASSEMIEFLCEVDPFLCEHLDLF